MATSPTPSLESLPGANSIGSFGEHNDYLSDSPLTLSGSSPPVSDSAICDDFSGATSSLESHHQTNSSASSSSASSTSSSGIGGGGGGGGGSGSGGGPGGGIITTSTGTRCTGCKSKQSDAVAKCIDCVNYLCSNCVTAHQFMHCFDGHSVFRINAFDNTITSPLNGGGNCLSDMQNNPISFLMQPQTPQPQSQLSKLMMNGFDSQSQQSRFSLKDDPISKLSISSLLNGGPPSSNGSNDILAVASAVTSTASTNNSSSAGNKQTSQYFCTRHKNELLKFFCRTCTVPVCKDCIVMDHPAGLHECEHVQDATPKQIDSLLQIIAEVRSKASDMRQLIKNSEHNSARLQVQYHKAQNEINETYQFFRSMLDERKQELFKELENFFNAKTMSHSVLMAKTQEHVEKVLQSCDCVERVSKHAGLSDALMLRKLMENRLQSFVQYGQELQSTCELDFVSNYQAIQVGVRNTFGYIRSSADTPTAKQPPIARPTSNNMLGSGSNSNGGSSGSLNGPLSVGSGLLGGGGNNPCPSSVLDRSFASVATSGTASVLGNQQNSFDSNIISKRFNSVNSLGPFVSDVNLQVNPYEKWSNGGSDNVFNGLSDQYTLPIGTAAGVGVNSNVNSTTGQGDSMIDLTSKLLSTTIFPPKSQIKRQKMIYHCKFGEFGVMEGQFTEPSGVAVNAQNDIIVADTNNHRIQIFDKEGRFKFQFGECGKRDGQLLYPNRVAVVRNSGDIIVTERSPTHQIQIYNQYGQFVRKFGANILQHPRGVTVDNKGRIIVVECKVMRVIIFDQSGNVLQKFGCSKHLEFPNGVVVNDKQEIFISDNRAHCVKVFNYEGTYLRQIGGEGITNYPIGVGINAAGEILIADNHNNFNLTIFTQDGQLVSALESKVKHAQCFDVALMDDGSVVLASKDYRLYIYRYVQVPPIGL